ncbi:hypothetical protein L596_015735 [Steinernema carpocapsae]|uniref:G-protein coupled receptors family 1 profile domain-containing protein n=1 Tax=Steinernema carpocapsae TaxID=34508 RepID=A0A4U5NGU5_STECR|nr:hypothetical protein L596_015735 [Steinernema carpocapsae]
MFEISEKAAFIIYIAEGSFIMLLNVAVILVIFCPGILREKNALVLLGGLCISDTVNAGAYFIAGIYRLSILENGEEELTRSRFSCFLLPHSTAFFFGYQLSALMTMVVSFDRLVAVFFPVKHMLFTLGKYNTYLILLGSFFFVLISYGFALLIEYGEREIYVNIYCYYIYTLQRQVWDYVLLFRVVTISLSVIVYVPICAKVYFIVKNHNQPKKIIKITTTIGLSSISALLCLVIPDLIMYVDYEGFLQYHKFFYFIGLNKSLINMFIYMLRHKEIRKGLLLAAGKPFGLKPSGVSWAYVDHVSVIHPPNHQAKLVSKILFQLRAKIN